MGSLAVRAVGAFGVFDPPHCAISVNHTEITCVTAPGVGKLDWTVEVGASNFAADGCCCWLLLLLLPWTLSACPLPVQVSGLVSSLPRVSYRHPVIHSLAVFAGNDSRFV